MKFKFSILKTLLYMFIFLNIFNSAFSKTTEYNYNVKNISNYFSGLISFDRIDYKNSQKFFKKLDNFEEHSSNYSSKLLQSLVNTENYNEALQHSRKLDKKKIYNFEKNLILGINEFKNRNYKNAKIYFNKLDPNFENLYIYEILKASLNAWSDFSESKNFNDLKGLYSINSAYKNLTDIQTIFAKCYVNDLKTDIFFENIIQNKKANFSRYNFFYANYLYNQNKFEQSIKLAESASAEYPRNLLINQYLKFLNKEEKNRNKFNCNNTADIMSEILYIFANVMSSQQDYRLSNFYLNLSKFLNPNFLSHNTLLAENMFILKRNTEAKKIYREIEKIGSVYKWHAKKQTVSIMEIEKENNTEKFFLNAYKAIKPNIYQTFDIANFLRNKEKYPEAIRLYSEILSKINLDHELYPKILERRGMSYERIDEWDKAEKDLINSLKLLPKEPYVMNYLAYSWIEKNMNIEKALSMLKEANKLKMSDGYITDSLGWAFYKLKNYSAAKDYLQIAIKLMPTDPVINDHFADCLWMNNHKIQARYYWNYVLKLDSAEESLKKKVQNKLLFGL